jgi:hypothetical protein
VNVSSVGPPCIYRPDRKVDELDLTDSVAFAQAVLDNFCVFLFAKIRDPTRHQPYRDPVASCRLSGLLALEIGIPGRSATNPN